VMSTLLKLGAALNSFELDGRSIKDFEQNVFLLFCLFTTTFYSGANQTDYFLSFI
jgi:hypothetical protein